MNNEKECLCKVCKPFKDQPEIKYVNKQSEIERLEKELQATREYLGKAIKSAEFFMGHADCRKDSWACKCSFCRDTESSKNLREARQYFKQKDEVRL